MSLYNLAMRRWLLIMLLFLLPYQAVWAGAAQFCMHDDSDGAPHLGHHGHKHRSASGDKAGTTISHADCSTCHMASAAPVLSADFEIAPVTLRKSYPYEQPRYLSRVPAGPERPDRRALPPAVRSGGCVVATLS